MKLMILTFKCKKNLSRLSTVARIFKAMNVKACLVIGSMDLLEHRTDGTNAFDTLYIECEKFPQHDLYQIAIGGERNILYYNII